MSETEHLSTLPEMEEATAHVMTIFIIIIIIIIIIINNINIITEVFHVQS